MTEEPSDHDEQLEGSLAYLLDGRIDVHDVLPLTAPLEELILSIRHSRVATWRHDQRESLAVDMDASGAIIGDEVRIELGQALVDVQTLAESCSACGGHRRLRDTLTSRAFSAVPRHSEPASSERTFDGPPGATS